MSTEVTLDHFLMNKISANQRRLVFLTSSQPVNSKCREFRRNAVAPIRVAPPSRFLPGTLTLGLGDAILADANH